MGCCRDTICQGSQDDTKIIRNGETFEHFEDVLKFIGRWGLTQRIQSCCLLSLWILVAFQNMGMVFLAGTPTHHCLVDEDTKNVTIPFTNKSGEIIYSSCEVFDVNATNATTVYDVNLETIRKISCKSAIGQWKYDKSNFENTIVSEWNLVCGSRWLSAFSKTIYFFGFFVGCFVFSHVSDRFGRRKTVLITSVGQTVFAVGVYFSPNYAVFTTLRFIVGSFTGGLTKSAYVLAQEWATSDTRMQLQAVASVTWGLGCVLLGVIANFCRDWRHLVLATSVPLALGVVVYLIVYPSPRWFLTKGREDEALKALHKAAKRNGRPLPDNFKLGAILHVKKESPSAVDLVRTPNLRKTSVIIWYGWFTVGMTGYGLAYNVGNLFGNIYLNFILLSLVQIGRLPIICVANYMRRRYSLISFALIAGTSTAMVAIATDGASTASLVLTLIGQMANGLMFALMYVYTTEVYPTPIRTTGLGIGSMWARIGAMLSPFVVLMAETSRRLPYVVFGSSLLLLAVLALLVPETYERPLVDTVEDAEEINAIRLRCRDKVDKKKHMDTRDASSFPLVDQDKVQL